MYLTKIVVYIVGPIEISPKKCFQHQVSMYLDMFPTSLAELELLVRKELEIGEVCLKSVTSFTVH